jgi:hypothetical protein
MTDMVFSLELKKIQTAASRRLSAICRIVMIEDVNDSHIRYLSCLTKPEGNIIPPQYRLDPDDSQKKRNQHDSAEDYSSPP